MAFSSLKKIVSTRLFSLKAIVCIFLGTIIVVRSLNLLVMCLRKVIVFDATKYWPVSEFYRTTISLDKIFVALSSIGIFFLILRNVSRLAKSIVGVIASGTALILTTNFIQGLVFGFALPVMGLFPETGQYYDEAVKIANPWYFLSSFEKLQPHLMQHSVTHPPGATLVFYWLNKLYGDPAAIAVAIAIASAFTTGVFLYGILRQECDKELSCFMVLVCLIIPAIQIYYLACLEAMVASFLIGALYFFLHPRPLMSIIGSVIFIFLASFLTFLFIFILPVLFAYQFLRKKDLLKPAIITCALAGIYGLIYFFLHYHYLRSFWIASSIENFNRATPFYHTLEYISTRLEGIIEILLFFSPFLILLCFRAFRAIKMKESRFHDLCLLGVGTLAAMFIAGFFRKGETARICLFIYPYLLLPIAVYFEKINLSLQEKTQILYLLFTQTIIMQLAGLYYW